jgi:hypothetical protein
MSVGQLLDLTDLQGQGQYPQNTCLVPWHRTRAAAVRNWTLTARITARQAVLLNLVL